MIPDTCGGGRLRKGKTDFTALVGEKTLVIRGVPALVCESCSEAYFSIETSRRIDDILRGSRAGRLLAAQPEAGRIELTMNA